MLTCIVFLIVSELNIFRSYFARNWPTLSPSHGFVVLGVAMECLGVNMLANLNKPTMTKKELGMAFWRVIIAAGILVFIFGIFNIIAVSSVRSPSLTLHMLNDHRASFSETASWVSQPA